ncbi:iron ABC transporter permease [Brevibacterium sp. GP-SGM9]|uniref:iron ABC transporter permease n=1 Tax=Brevibacterium sp. GP-SGM9 TaxID=3376990 RepID=UPI0039A6E647
MRQTPSRQAPAAMTAADPVDGGAAGPADAPGPADTAGPAAPSKAAGIAAAGAVLVAAVLALVAAGLWHLTQGTSGLSVGGLVSGLLGEDSHIGGVPVSEIFAGSRLPRLAAGILVGAALGIAGALLQSVTRNLLASPDTLAVAAGSHFALTLLAALGLTLPLWASSASAALGGLIAAGAVLGLAGRAVSTETTRIILAGSAIAMALDAGTGLLLILFKENTVGLYAWGNGSLAQLSIDASLRAAPVIAVTLGVSLLLTRRLDVLALGDDAASSLGISVRTTRFAAILCGVILTATSVTLAGPIAFVGLGAPVLAHLIASRVRVLGRHILLLPVSGLLGALLIVLADAIIRAMLGAQGAASIPTGTPTAMLGGLLIIVLAMRLRDAGSARGGGVGGSGLRTPLRTRRRFGLILTIGILTVLGMLVLGLLAGSMWLRLGDIQLWLGDQAPALVDRAFNERLPRTIAACLAGAALGLAGCLVQSTVRNPLAEPGVLGITAGAGLGAVIVVTGFGGARPLLITGALIASVLTFGLVAALSWKDGFLPERFVLIGIGIGYTITAMTTFLLLRVDPWETPRLFTWLSGTTYGRTLPDVVPVTIALVIAVPAMLLCARRLDILALDEDTPRLLGIRTAPTRLGVLLVAAVLAAVSVVAIGVVGFAGLIAPHLARFLVGSHHRRVIPVSLLIGAALVCLADTIGRTVVAPAQVPAGLMIALIGAPYFVWLLKRSRA